MIEKYSPEVIFVWKYFVLVGQIGTAGIDQVDAGEVVLTGNVLGAQVFFDADRVIGAALHRRVVGNNDALDSINASDAGDDACPGHIVFAIHVVGGKLGKLKKGRTWIDQQIDTLSGQQFASSLMTCLIALATALFDLFDQGFQIIHQRLHLSGVVSEGVGPGVELRG